MSNLPMEKRILYSNTFCTYREPKENKIICKHPYSFKLCDLDLCPLVQEYFANVVFLPEGITLVVKETSAEKIAGSWKKIPLKIDLDNEEEVIGIIKDQASKITNKNMEVLLERVHRIFERYRFLKEKGKKIPILEEEEEEEVSEEFEETEFEEEEYAEENV